MIKEHTTKQIGNDSKSLCYMNRLHINNTISRAKCTTDEADLVLKPIFLLKQDIGSNQVDIVGDADTKVALDAHRERRIAQ